jgi:hypothetical protein
VDQPVNPVGPLENAIFLRLDAKRLSLLDYFLRLFKNECMGKGVTIDLGIQITYLPTYVLLT